MVVLEGHEGEELVGGAGEKEGARAEGVQGGEGRGEFGGGGGRQED